MRLNCVFGGKNFPIYNSKISSGNAIIAVFNIVLMVFVIGTALAVYISMKMKTKTNNLNQEVEMNMSQIKKSIEEEYELEQCKKKDAVGIIQEILEEVQEKNIGDYYNYNNHMYRGMVFVENDEHSPCVFLRWRYLDTNNYVKNPKFRLQDDAYSDEGAEVIELHGLKFWKSFYAILKWWEKVPEKIALIHKPRTGRNDA